MKRVSVAIAIASALFLRAANSRSGATPGDQRDAPQIQTTASHNNAPADASPILRNPGSSAPTGTQTTTYAYNYYYPAPEAGLTIIGQIAGIISAVLLTIFIGGLWLTSIWQWRSIKDQADATKASVELANKTLVMQFRPKLMVRNFVITPAIDIRPNETTIFIRNYHVTGQFYLANVGGSPATIIESFCEVYWHRGPLPMRRLYEGLDGNNPILGKVEAGDRKTVIFESAEPIPIGHIEIGDFNFPNFSPQWFVYVMGWIEYADALSFERRTAFCRKYDFRTNRLYPINDPDYEHAE